MKKITLLGVFLSILNLGGCKTATLVFYEHVPSKKFYDTYEINENLHDPFIDDNILSVISFKDIDNPSSYIVWLAFYTSEYEREVFLEKAKIKNSKIESVINKTVTLDKVHEKSKGYKNSFNIFRISGKDLEMIYSEDGNLIIEVVYHIDDKKIEKQFEIKKRLEKQTIYPT